MCCWPKCYPFSTDFSFQNLVFGIYLNFQWQKSLKNQYLPHSESKSYQINSIHPVHQGLSTNTKDTFQFLWNFQLQFNLIFSEKIIQYSKTSTLQVQTPWNQVDAPLLKRDQKCDLKQPSSVDLISTNETKQNKWTTFLHR